MNGFFLTGKQFRCHGHILNVRGCNLQGMHQPSVFVDPNVRLIAEMLVENKKYTLDEIWDVIITYSNEPEARGEHYFEVEMFDINKENTDLLDDAKVREYLSFVVPVPYKNTFILRNQIYAYAKSPGYTIDEYCVRVNGSQIFKEYTTKLKEQSGASLKNYDEISRLEFKDFRDTSGNLIAWMWVGLSRFEKQIPSINHMFILQLMRILLI